MNKMWTKTLRNFLVANIVILWPVLWIGLSWVPNMVKVETREGVEACLVYGGETMRGEESGWWGEGPVWRFFLPRGTKWTDFCIQSDGDGGKEDLRTIWLQKWLFKFGRSGTELSTCEGEEKTWGMRDGCWGQVRLASRTVVLGLLGLETLLLVASVGFARRRPNSGEKGWCGTMGVGLMLTLVMEMVLPLQSYLANASIFHYLLGDLIPVLTVRFAVLAVLAVMGLRALEYCFGRWTLGLAFAFAVCIYLESGVLSIGLPTLKGGWWFFENPARAFWDSAVWVAIFGVVFLLSHPLQNHWGKAATCLAILAASSLLDVKREEKIDTSKFVVNELLPIATVIQSVEYSPTTNVLVFVIDSLEREQAHAVMEDAEFGTELREQFRGFTEYLDNVGAGESSAAAVANLFTGQYPDSAADIVDYYESVFAKESLLNDYVENDWNVHIAPSALHHGYTSKRNVYEPDGEGLPVLRQPVMEGQPWNLMEFCRFRWLPFAFKARFLWLAPKGLSKRNGPQWEREWELFPFLGKAPLSQTRNGTFAFFHTEGVHIPVEYNRYGEQLASPANDNTACVEMGVFILRQLGSLFDIYRKRGLYDNALILVLADHGNHGREANSSMFQADGLPGHARPFLWIKPVGAMHPFTSSDLPTSHAQIHVVLRASSRKVLDDATIQHIMPKSERLFRRVSLLAHKKTDWIVGPDGSFSVTTAELDHNMGDERRPLRMGRNYSLDIDQIEKERLDIRFDNLFVVRTPGLDSATTGMTLRFRVDDPAKNYLVRLTMKMGGRGSPDEKGAVMLFRSSLTDDWTKVEHGAHAVVILEHCIPDADGWISIDGQRGAGSHSCVLFQELAINREN